MAYKRKEIIDMIYITETTPIDTDAECPIIPVHDMESLA